VFRLIFHGNILKLAVFNPATVIATCLALIGVYLSTSFVSAANLQPYSLRSIWFIEDADPPYWEIRVTCDDQRTYRYMVRYEQRGPWCAKQAPELCAEDKVELAFELCKSSYADIIAENQRKSALEAEELAARDRQREELLRREAVLQERRQLLDGRKAELQRREQALRNREQSLAERKARLQ